MYEMSGRPHFLKRRVYDTQEQLFNGCGVIVGIWGPSIGVKNFTSLGNHETYRSMFCVRSSYQFVDEISMR